MQEVIQVFKTGNKVTTKLLETKCELHLTKTQKYLIYTRV